MLGQLKKKYPPQISLSIGNTEGDLQGGRRGEGVGVCITASGNISLKLFMAFLETTELLIFWYVVAEHHFARL